MTPAHTFLWAWRSVYTGAGAKTPMKHESYQMYRLALVNHLTREHGWEAQEGALPGVPVLEGLHAEAEALQALHHGHNNLGQAGAKQNVGNDHGGVGERSKRARDTARYHPADKPHLSHAR